MPEPIDAWWSRRRFSRGLDVPYPVGRYREAWASFPVLVRQYHPELNGGITLTQVPPAADVWLTWQCESGHVFVATPEEQRSRPGRERRRSSWCPECTRGARDTAVGPSRRGAPTGRSRSEGGRPARGGARSPDLVERAPGSSRPRRRLCPRTPDLPPGTPFSSGCAPRPASAVEARVRADLARALPFDPAIDAVRLSRPFFDHLEAWPDIVLADLRVAVEYDTVGRHGLEHVGPREEADRRKDAALRAVGWEVVRIRTGRLPPLGQHDVVAPAWSSSLVPRVLDALRGVRGDLIVDAWCAEASAGAKNDGVAS